MRIVYVEGELYEDVLVAKIGFLKAEHRYVSNVLARKRYNL